jgi:hypothetical protein
MYPGAVRFVSRRRRFRGNPHPCHTGSMTDRSWLRELDDSQPIKLPSDDLLEGTTPARFVSGRLVRMDADTLWFDIRTKFEAPLRRVFWPVDEPMPQLGEEHVLYVDDDWHVDDRPLTIYCGEVGFRCTTYTLNEEDIRRRFVVGGRVSGYVIRPMKGGFLVDIGPYKASLNYRDCPQMRDHPGKWLARHIQCEIVDMDQPMIVVKHVDGEPSEAESPKPNTP